MEAHDNPACMGLMKKPSIDCGDKRCAPVHVAIKDRHFTPTQSIVPWIGHLTDIA
jgi:hypothetical protein